MNGTDFQATERARLFGAIKGLNRRLRVAAGLPVAGRHTDFPGICAAAAKKRKNTVRPMKPYREKTVVVSVKLPLTMLARLDSAAAAADTDRSKLTRDAIRERLQMGGGR
jgi:hypothetical protein